MLTGSEKFLRDRSEAQLLRKRMENHRRLRLWYFSIVVAQMLLGACVVVAVMWAMTSLIRWSP